MVLTFKRWDCWIVVSVDHALDPFRWPTGKEEFVKNEHEVLLRLVHAETGEQMAHRMSADEWHALHVTLEDVKFSALPSAPPAERGCPHCGGPSAGTFTNLCPTAYRGQDCTLSYKRPATNCRKCGQLYENCRC